jgi:hypothetical protein
MFVQKVCAACTSEAVAWLSTEIVDWPGLFSFESASWQPESRPSSFDGRHE